MKRREFLKAGAAVAAAAAVSRWFKDLPEALAGRAGATERGNAPTLARRPYGKTGVKLSIIGLGGIVVTGAEPKHAAKVVAKAVEMGVNYFDVAPTYGDAELKLGPALRPYRKKVFLACKTTQRRRDRAEAELKQSLKRLQTDYLDLYQLHAIKDVGKDVDAAFARGGAMEAFVAAKKAGIVRHLGFSAHSVEAALAAMDRYDFDSILFPVQFACWHAGKFGPQVVGKARAKKAAILTIKSTALGPWPSKDHPDRKKYPKCWYQPLTDPRQIELALRFALSQPVTAAVPPGQESLFWAALRIAMDFRPLTPAEADQVKAWAAKVEPLFRHRPKKKA